MNGLPPRSARLFHEVTSEGFRAVVTTRLHWWYGHYDPAIRQPMRCGGSLCGYCDAGRNPELRFVLGAEVRGARGLIELRERHRPFIDSLGDEPSETVGALIDVYKKGGAANSPVEFELRGRRDVAEWDIRLLVEALGIHRSPSSGEIRVATQLPDLISTDLS